MTAAPSFLSRLWAGLTHSVNLKRAARTFLVSFAVLFVPGFLDWLHDLTAWAPGTSFPSLSPLAALFVSGIASGLIGAVNLLWNAVETATGKGFLRQVPPVQ